MFGPALVHTTTDDAGDRVRMLSVGGSVQSGTYLDERRMRAPFAYLRSFDVVFDAHAAVRSVALLGGGGFSWPKQALSEHPDLRMTVAEPDPAMVDIARRWFFLSELERLAAGRLEVACCDGRALLAAGGSYDAVVNDMFAAGRPAGGLDTPEGVALVRSRLASGGVYVVNVAGGERALAPVLELLGGSFAHTWVVPADDNYLVVASDGQWG